MLLPGERVLDLSSFHGTMLALLEAGEAALAAVRAAVRSGGAGIGEILPLAEVELRAPVPQARKVLALAGNYAEHVKEGGRPSHPKELTYPYFFLKPGSTALVGSGGPILSRPLARKLDYEGELAVVIGRRGRDIPEAEALGFVAGYTCFNDISERALASKEEPRAERERDRFFDWLVGKWYDNGAPCGPWMATADEIPDPHALDLRTWVNGELRQQASTGEMIFSVPEIIAWISRFTTLEAGDIIATGTPAGVGNASGRLLKPGDVVEVEISGIGKLINPVQAL